MPLMLQSGTRSLHGGSDDGALRPSRPQVRVRSLLERADIEIDGDRPWDIQVCDPSFYKRIARRGMTGAGEAYVEGLWECEAIDEFFDRALRADLPHAMRFTPYVLRRSLAHALVNRQSRARAERNARDHYDRGNDLFSAMLDPRMNYSCGYFSGGATALAEAQEAKLDLICRKLGIESGMRVLDIGCGWGGFAGFAAERYGADVTGITLAPAQLQLARERYDHLPVRFELRDYRAVSETYDRVVSIGMFEHVGQKNYAEFMRVLDRCLADDGLALLHFFASKRSFPNTLDSEVDWFERYIFPWLVIPSLAQVGRAIDGRFVVEDLHNFGADYDPTLMAWWRNFDNAWPELQARYDDRFYRLWRFYLRGAAGSFRSRKYQLWQIVLSKRGVPGGYRSIR